MEHNQACRGVEFSPKTWVCKAKHLVSQTRKEVGQHGEKRHGKERKGKKKNAVNSKFLN